MTCFLMGMMMMIIMMMMMMMMRMMQEDKRCKDGKRTHQAVNQRHIDMLIDITRYPLLRPLYTSYIWMLKLKKKQNKMPDFAVRIKPQYMILSQCQICQYR